MWLSEWLNGGWEQSRRDQSDLFIALLIFSHYIYFLLAYLILYHYSLTLSDLYEIYRWNYRKM